METKRLFCLALSLCLSLPALADEYGPRHTPSGRNATLGVAMETPFAEYVAQTRTVIAETRQDLTDANRDKVIDDNSPFEWAPDPASCNTDGRPRGALLIHGLTDSPFLMRDVGRRLTAACYLVRSLLLPGHGTVPGDLFKVHRKAWVEAVQYGIGSFSDRTTDVVVVGFSTGAAAAVENQLANGAGSEKVRALVLLSPAIEIKNEFAFAANWYKFRKFFVALNIKSKEEFIKKGWIDVAPDEDPVKYESFTKNAADQIYELTKEIGARKAETLSVPVFMAISADDNTVNAEGAVTFFEKTGDPRSRLVLYTKDTEAPADEDRRIVRRSSVYEDQRILDFSHTAIPVAPDNAHYGRNGDYRNCMHYLKDPEDWDTCKAGGSNVWLGENSQENMDDHKIQRLTYNPDFDALVRAILAFLEDVR